ncbi:pyridoxal phosphate-dependent aminotransferase [Streptomyces sp. CNQ431]|uniref:pyridoxal phosphate-dependent aminotransferase n=1 Tax=Streptomyces sp. CNQ431 TaxID=1571532 RepID=UPI00053DDD32|nr:pyridoxal phosphate-dependent aminotransferase [Streptomyces sp. CNQ431]
MGTSIPFAPWNFMLDVDGVNYALPEQAAYARRHPGSEILNLSSGINALRPPDVLVDTVVTCARDPLFWHDYDGPEGHLVGRAAVAAYETVRGGGTVALGPSHVLVTAGASAALALAARGLHELARVRAARPVALLPVPTFPLAGAALADAGFTVEEVAGDAPGSRVPTVAELIAAAPPETSVVYVNTFNNPTGERYEDAALRILVRWARDHEVHILHDTVSSDVCASGELPLLPAIAAAEGYAAGLITVSSLSKVRAVPGFRIGWLVADPSLVGELARLNELGAPSSPGIAAPALLLDRMTTLAVDAAEGRCPADAPRRAQELLAALLKPYRTVTPGLEEVTAAVAGALGSEETVERLRSWRAELRSTLAENVALLAEGVGGELTEAPAWRGDFNTFVGIPALAGRNHLDLCHRLFREFGLQTLPAPAFGRDEPWWARRGTYRTRLSFALPTSRWAAGLRRLDRAVKELSR